MSRTTSSHQGVDPSAPGTVIRGALVAEAALTLGLGTYITFFPRHYLNVNMGAAATQITTTAIQLTQQYGFVNIFTGAVVTLFVSNSRLAIEARPVLYKAFLGFELVMAPLVAWQGTTEGGMAKGPMFNNAVLFAVFAGWRVFTLGWKPEWFGRYLEGKKAE